MQPYHCQSTRGHILALAFGVLIVFLVIGGSIWIIANLNENMMPMNQMPMRR